MMNERLCHRLLVSQSGKRVTLCTYMGSLLFRLYKKWPYLRMSQPVGPGPSSSMNDNRIMRSAELLPSGCC